MTDGKKLYPKNMTRDELKGFFSDAGEKPFRGAQLFRGMYARGLSSFDEMTDLPAALRRRLAETAALFTLAPREVLISRRDGSRKYLFETVDGHLVESVFMRYDYGNVVCVSSQAGCRMGCAFCASGFGGLRRGLRSGEMADQLLRARLDTGEDIGRIVVMGVGEPLDNFDELKRFIETVGDAEGLGIGRRNITVSTCGLPPGIERMAAELPQVGLSISLHAPNDRLRDTLLPVNKRYALAALLKAVRGHIARTGRRATFEYALIAGMNDGAECAAELARLLRGMNCHVNLIPLNRVEETGFCGSGRAETERFRAALAAAGLRVTVRRSLGADIRAACGQLRAKTPSKIGG
ncbi:MAG: 23S rRNA (adenine(2503)-C(2))-methyltransferase RlmN [Clostridiales Family XIII bacterium]|nr:23S rRNA (adenine(2503)-C(2))-methyltransferase RlmN [Clostridiales Family XIII bacterium]